MLPGLKRWTRRLGPADAKPPLDLDRVGGITFQTTGPIASPVFHPPGPTYRMPTEEPDRHPADKPTAS